MDKKGLRIVFMGTPEFAVESLRALVEEGYNIVGVITVPDKPVGRGHKIAFSAVKEYALAQGLPLLQPDKLKDNDFLEDLRAWQADVQVVVAFRMLPEVVWNMPKYGTFNLHASLLPQYRGAAPINWAIINGEHETGATTFFLTHEIDTGRIILQKKIAIEERDNAGSIHDKLMIMGAGMVTETLDRLLVGKMDAVAQEELISHEHSLKPAPKIFKDMCEIKRDLSAIEAHNLVRGLSPYPAAWIEVQFPQLAESTQIKVFEAQPEIIAHTYPLGEVVLEEKHDAKLALKDGFLYLKEIQAPGKKRMKIGDFLNGLK